jgi:hypothetical protein
MFVAAGDDFLGSSDQKLSINMGRVLNGDDAMGLV